MTRRAPALARPTGRGTQYSMPLRAEMPCVVGVLHLAHLGDGVGHRDQLGGALRPVTTTLVFGARSRDGGDHVGRRHPAVLHDVGELVEDRAGRSGRRPASPRSAAQASRPSCAVRSRSVDSQVKPSPSVCHSMPRWSASLRSPVFHLPPLTNCTTPTVQPRAQPRPITPKADDDLPLPWPVFSDDPRLRTCHGPTLEASGPSPVAPPARSGDGGAGGGPRGLRHHQRRRQVVGGDRAVPAAGPPGRAGGAVQGPEHGAQRRGHRRRRRDRPRPVGAGPGRRRRARGRHEPHPAQADRRAHQPGGGAGPGPSGERSAAEYHAAKASLRPVVARRPGRPAPPLRRGDLRGRRRRGRDQPARPRPRQPAARPRRRPAGDRGGRHRARRGVRRRSTAPWPCCPTTCAAACGASSSTASGATRRCSATPAPSSSAAAACRPSGSCPWLPGVDLDAEDSLALDRWDTDRRADRRADGRSARTSAVLDVAAVRLPRWPTSATSTRCGSSRACPVRWVRGGAELGRPDLVVLPGSKATRDDLAWLRRSGLAARHRRPAAGRRAVVAICAGAQMAGQRDRRSRRRRGAARGRSTGLGWLPRRDPLRARQGARPARRRGSSSGPAAGAAGRPATASTTAGSPRAGAAPSRGWSADDGTALGWRRRTGGRAPPRCTACSRTTASGPRSCRGRPPRSADRRRRLGTVSFAGARQARLDRIADTLEAHLDLARLFAIIEQGAVRDRPGPDADDHHRRLPVDRSPTLVGHLRWRIGAPGPDDLVGRELVAAPQELVAAVASTAAGRGSDDPQVLGSLWWQAYVYRVAGTTLAAWALTGAAPDPAAAGCGVGIARSRPSSLLVDPAAAVVTDLTRARRADLRPTTSTRWPTPCGSTTGWERSCSGATRRRASVRCSGPSAPPTAPRRSARRSTPSGPPFPTTSRRWVTGWSPAGRSSERRAACGGRPPPPAARSAPTARSSRAPRSRPVILVIANNDLDLLALRVAVEGLPAGFPPGAGPRRRRSRRERRAAGPRRRAGRDRAAAQGPGGVDGALRRAARRCPAQGVAAAGLRRRGHRRRRADPPVDGAGRHRHRGLRLPGPRRPGQPGQPAALRGRHRAARGLRLRAARRRPAGGRARSSGPRPDPADGRRRHLPGRRAGRRHPGRRAALRRDRGAGRQRPGRVVLLAAGRARRAPAGGPRRCCEGADVVVTTTWAAGGAVPAGDARPTPAAAGRRVGVPARRARRARPAGRRPRPGRPSSGRRARRAGAARRGAGRWPSPSSTGASSARRSRSRRSSTTATSSASACPPTVPCPTGWSASPAWPSASPACVDPPADKRVAIVLSAYPTKRSRHRQRRRPRHAGQPAAPARRAARRRLRPGRCRRGDERRRRPHGPPGRRPHLRRHDRSPPAAVVARSVGCSTSTTTSAWFATLPAELRDRVRALGAGPRRGLRPRRCTSCFAGIDLGDVVVAIQPPRGFGDDPIGAYHDPDLPPPHHYLAFYRWLDVGFGRRRRRAPGQARHPRVAAGQGRRAVGGSCIPDAALGDLPLLYPFVVNDPGEGTQAKRRTHAVIIDHLPPPMTRAETYDDLARVERLLDEYAKVEALDPAKLPALQGQVWDLLVTSELARDLGVEAHARPRRLRRHGQPRRRLPLRPQGRPDPRRPPRARVAPPEGEAARRVGAGHLPPAPGRRAVAAGQAVAAELGRRARRRRHRRRGPGGGRLPGPRRGPGRRRLGAGALPATPAAPRGDDADAALGGASGWSRRWRRTADEIDNLLAGLDGRHVPAGPSGAPDPRRRPRAADRPELLRHRPQGRALAPGLGRRAGCWPSASSSGTWPRPAPRPARSASSCGARPPCAPRATTWPRPWPCSACGPAGTPHSGRVEGLEVIPPAELGRPRVDVTVRISGFFRDAFPDVVDLLDDAVEPGRRAATRTPTRTRCGRPAPPTPGSSARRPGTYGSGIFEAIETRSWRTRADLAEVYLAWSGYGYRRGERTAWPRPRRCAAASPPSTWRSRTRTTASTTSSTATTTSRTTAAWSPPSRPSPDERPGRGSATPPTRPAPGALPGRGGGTGGAHPGAQPQVAGRHAPPRLQGRLRGGRHRRLPLRLRRHRRRRRGLDVRAGDRRPTWPIPRCATFYERSNPWALRGICERLLEAAERGMWDASAEARATLRDGLLAAEGREERRPDAET